MKHPDKWRDTVDPFTLPYKKFEPLEILGYPHAGNDVFHVKGATRTGQQHQRNQRRKNTFHNSFTRSFNFSL